MKRVDLVYHLAGTHRPLLFTDVGIHLFTVFRILLCTLDLIQYRFHGLVMEEELSLDSNRAIM